MIFERIRSIMKEEMKAKNMTQIAFSQSISADQSYLGKFLRGENNTISLKYVSIFCKEYGFSMNWLVLNLGQKYLKSTLPDKDNIEQYSNDELENLKDLVKFQREKIKSLELELDSFKNRENIYEEPEGYPS